MISILMIFVSGWTYPPGWRDEVQIDPSEQCAHCKVIADGSSKVHCAYRHLGETNPRCSDLWYGRSTDTGIEWTREQLDVTPPPVADRSCDIAIKDSMVFIPFEMAQNRNNVYFQKSLDYGELWLPEGILITDPDALGDHSSHPGIVVDDTLLHVFFADNRNGKTNFEIYHSVSTDWGDNWSHPNGRITVADSNSWHPAVTCNGPSVHIVWGDNRGDPSNYEIYYNRSDDHCQHWVYGVNPGGLRLTSIAGRSDYPDIASYGNTIHVVWWDQRKFGPGIYYKRSTDNGNTWEAEVKLDADYGSYPAIAADERGVYVVWQAGHQAACSTPEPARRECAQATGSHRLGCQY